jgi:hypothetical protein
MLRRGATFERQKNTEDVGDFYGSAMGCIPPEIGDFRRENRMMMNHWVKGYTIFGQPYIYIYGIHGRERGER